MKPFLTAALYIAFVLAVAAVALSAQSDASRAFPEPINPHVAALGRQEGGATSPGNTTRPSSLSAAPMSVDPTPPTVLPAGPIVGSDEPSARPTSLPRTLIGMIVGVATHYWNGAGYYAAAGPGLRRAIGPDWRNHAVVVTAFVNGQVRSVSLELTDWCLCTRTADRILDLSDDAFAHICGALGVGVCRVEVQWAVQ